MDSQFKIGKPTTAYKAEFQEPQRTAYVYFDTQDKVSLGAGVCEIPVGSSNQKHAHDDADEVIYVLSGEVRFVFPTESVILKPLEAIYIPSGLEHQIFNAGNSAAWHTFTFSNAESAAKVRNKYRQPIEK